MGTNYLREDTETRCKVYNKVAQELAKCGYIDKLTADTLHDIMTNNPDKLINEQRNKIRASHPALYITEERDKTQSEVKAVADKIAGLFEWAHQALTTGEFAQYIHYTTEEIAQYIAVGEEGRAIPQDTASEK